MAQSHLLMYDRETIAFLAQRIGKQVILPRRESTEFAGFSRRSSQRATPTTSSSAKHDGDDFPGYPRSRELLQKPQKSPSLLDPDKRTTEPNSHDPISHEYWPNGRSPPKGPRALVTPSSFPSEDDTNKIAISELLKLEANERRQSFSSSGQHIFRNTDEVLNDIDGPSGSARFSDNSIRLESQTATEYSKSQATTGRVPSVIEGRSLNEAACQGSISESVAKVVKNDSAKIVGSSEDNRGAAPISFRGRPFDPGQVTISQHYIGSKTCDIVPAAPSSPLLPAFSEHKANSIAPTLDRSKIFDSPQLPFIQKSLGSHLRFIADDTKSLSSDLSISSGRTPSETSSTPSDMRDVGAAITRVATSPPSFSPVLIGNETFRCARCIKRSGLPSATASKRTGSSLRPTGHKALYLASTEEVKSGLLDESVRPTKRQKLDHTEGHGLLHVPKTLNLQGDCNRTTSPPIQTQACLKDKPSSSENTVLNHSLNGSVGSADDRASLQAHSPIEHSVIPIEAPAPGPNKDHEQSKSVSEARSTSVTTDRGQCQEPAKQLTVDAHIPSEPGIESDRRPLRAREFPIQPISTAVETSDFVDIDSFNISVRPYESNITLLDSDPSAEKAPGAQARKRSLTHGSDVDNDDALSGKSMSIESDQPEPTDTNNSFRCSPSPALIADKFDSLERQDHVKSTVELPSSERLGSISPLCKRPPTTINASSVNLSATSINTPKSNDVTNTYASAIADHNHRHSSAAKIYSEAANPSLKKYPLTPCSMCGKPVFTPFAKNTTKTLCTGCAKGNESNLPAPCTTTLNDRLLSPESFNMASLNQAPLSPTSKKAVSLDRSKQSPQSKARAQHSRPLKFFPEQSSPFRTAPLRTQRQFMTVKANGAPGLSSRPVINPQQPKLAINGHIGVETRVDLPPSPALTKQHEKTIPLAIPPPPERVSQDGKAPGHPEANDGQKQLTPHVGSPHETGKGSSIVHIEAAPAINEADIEQRQYAGESDQRIKDLERALTAKELEFERAKVEIAALKEQSSRNNKLEHDNTINANNRTITSLREELQKLQQQRGKETPHSIYTEKDLLKAWPQYHPKNVWFNRSAKIAEIKKRPSRKATFGKRLANIRKERSNVHHEVDRTPPTSHSIPEPSRHDRDVEETRPPGGLESYGAGSPEPTVISDGESDKELTLEELIGVPPNAIPTIYDKALAYRDGTRDKKGKLPRAKVVYKVGRNIAGQLK
ncbi:MAG: hypothetical protein M1835_000962 [Candelina submexicana]|nr:MAG: hypothetical protein M1835_000962 [Candelina submexicana]